MTDSWNHPIILSCQQETEKLGETLARTMKEGLVFLIGPLGAGKTTLVRGWLRGLGHTDHVKSPTYTIIEPYEIKGKQILHIDLYRIEKQRELDYIDLMEQLEETHLQFIEWPEHGRGRLPSPNFVIDLSYHESGRQATVEKIND